MSRDNSACNNTHARTVRYTHPKSRSLRQHVVGVLLPVLAMILLLLLRAPVAIAQSMSCPSNYPPSIQCVSPSLGPWFYVVVYPAGFPQQFPSADAAVNAWFAQVQQGTPTAWCSIQISSVDTSCSIPAGVVDGCLQVDGQLTQSTLFAATTYQWPPQSGSGLTACSLSFSGPTTLVYGGRFATCPAGYVQTYNTSGGESFTGAIGISYVDGQDTSTPDYWCVPQQQYYLMLANGPPVPGPCNGSSSNQGCVHTPEPIDLATGNESLTEPDDYQSADGRLRLTRTFNSLNAAGTVIGVGWQNNLFARQIATSAAIASKLQPQVRSDSYPDPATACVQGWAQLASNQSDGAGVTASWDGQYCQLSNGTALTVYNTVPTYDKTTPAAVWVQRPGGAVFQFSCSYGSSGSATGGCGTTSSAAFQLSVSSTGFVVTDEDATVETYNFSGQLQAITYRGGFVLSFTYGNGQIANVTDTFGRTLSFSYGTSGQLSQVMTPDGAVQYAYDATGNLITVTHVDGTVRGYLYSDAQNPNALTEIVDENNSPYALITYDGQGRAVQSQLAGGVWASSVDYTNPSVPIVTDAFGVARTYQFAVINGQSRLQSIVGAPCNVCEASPAQSYDALGHYTRKTDWNGNATLYQYDELGRELMRTEAYGAPQQRTVSTIWDLNFSVPDSISEPGRTTSFTYDSTGNLLTKTVTDTASSVSRTWTYSNYSSFGAPQNIDGPRTDVSDVTQLTYYPITAGDPRSGQLQQITDALGNVTTFNSYDPSGRLTQWTDPNGLVTSLTYTARGWLASRQVGTEITQYTYDGVGQLQSITLPSGISFSYSYNAAHQLVGIQDQLRNRIVYSVDAMGNRTSESVYDANGNITFTHSQVFNALNQLSQDVGAQNQTIAYSYDANGNRTGITNQLGGQSSAVYDALNRLTASVDAAGEQVQKNYTPLDQIASVTDPRGLATMYYANALGDVSGVVSPDSGTTSSIYDSAGNLVGRTDAKGQQTRYQYDALNRLTKITRADQSTVTISYDQGPNGIGRITGMTDESGSTAWNYDQHGRVIQRSAVIGANTLTTSYQYDGTGRLVSTSLPSGNKINYAWSNGQIVAVTLNGPASKGGAATPMLSNIVYRPFGGPAGWILGNGESVVRAVDLDGRVVADPVETISYDAGSRVNSRILGNASILKDTETFGYDAANRLVSYTDSNNTVGFEYDLSGNRTQQTINGIETDFNIDTGSNRILSVVQPQTPSAARRAPHERRDYAMRPKPSSSLGGGLVRVVLGGSLVVISLDKSSITVGQSATLSWGGIDLRSCTASGSWAGTQPAAGSMVEIPAVAGTYTYTITCSSVFGNVTDSATLTVTGVPPGKTPFISDNNGSLLSDGTFQYTFDAAGRMSAAQTIATESGVPLMASTYMQNGLGQRVEVTTGGTQSTESLYVYDETGHIQGEYTNPSSGGDMTETVWFGDIPVAVLKPAQTYFIHADYLNTPRQIDNASGQAVWAWEPMAFGANSPNGDPLKTGTSFQYDLRFPGQIVDGVTGLNYNYFRDFDPAVGRYVESDPIGLNGGSYSTYAYVGGNPISRTDPLGLTWAESFGMGWAWLTGTAPPNTVYGPLTNQSQDMMQSPGVQNAINYFNQKNAGKCPSQWAPVKGYDYSFGLKGLWQSGLNSTQQFVGSYSVNIYPNANGTLDVQVYNTTSMTSFFYGIYPNAWNPPNGYPMGNTSQEYLGTVPASTGATNCGCGNQ